MCGLVAYYKSADRPLSPHLIEDMNNAMQHRGRDDFGFCFSNAERVTSWRDNDRPNVLNGRGVAMAHRRMSIFDLSTAGRQPFVSHDGRISLVFNGEVYNYIELRDELIKAGYSFHTDCDTEVVLCAYEHWGTDCFQHFNGVWAIVIWDRAKQEMVACRDRLGEKPLFYAEVEGDYLFSSEIKPLLLHPSITAAPNQRSLLRFIKTGTPPLEGESFYEGIKTVKPSTVMTIRDGQVTESTFWTLEIGAHPRRQDTKQLTEELNALLTDAVRMRMRGDLRVGSMLSGGLDSTSVITSITQVLEARGDESRSIGDTLQAFTASFPGLPIDESDKVEELCRQIEIAVGHVYPVDLDGVEDRLHNVAQNLEAPFWSPAIIVHDALMKLIRASDVRVVLDGLGSDEIFAGYDWWLPEIVRSNLGNFQFKHALANLRGMHELHGRNFIKELVRVCLPEALPDLLDTFSRRRQGLPPAWHSDLFVDDSVLADVKEREFTRGSRLDRELQDTLLGYNVPRWAHMADNISMSNGVVCRSPFLDSRLLDFAFSIDDNLKIRDGIPKYILRETKRDQLPASIVDDVKKMQFSGPGELWLNGALKPFAMSLRDGKDVKLAEFVRQDKLSNLIDNFYQSGKESPFTLWRLVNAEAWMRAFF